MDNKNAKQSFDRADQQRFMCLSHAFDIIDVFALPALSPDQMDDYADIKKYLFDKFKPQTTEWLQIMYGEDIADKLTG